MGLDACERVRAAWLRGRSGIDSDNIVVPPGYRAEVLYRWGDPAGIAGAQPEFRFDGSNSAAEQELQAGMHHDAVELFSRFRRAVPSRNQPRVHRRRPVAR